MAKGSKLPKFTLVKNKKEERWDLKPDGSTDVLKSFERKQDATRGGVLQKAIGGEGSVKIKKEDGKIQEERTFPGKKDPPGSPG